MNGTRTHTPVGSSLIATLCAVTLVAGAVQAQPYPSKTIEFVAQSSPGGGTDLFMRIGGCGSAAAINAGASPVCCH